MPEPKRSTSLAHRFPDCIQLLNLILALSHVSVSSFSSLERKKLTKVSNKEILGVFAVSALGPRFLFFLVFGAAFSCV
jgi:hypothetical protein